MKIQIGNDGSLAMLHDDAVDLSEFGRVEIQRASHVEFNNRASCWIVRSAKTMNVFTSGFKTRADALAWEKTYYSPGGAGWNELNGGK